MSYRESVVDIVALEVLDPMALVNSSSNNSLASGGFHHLAHYHRIADESQMRLSNNYILEET